MDTNEVIGPSQSITACLLVPLNFFPFAPSACFCSFLLYPSSVPRLLPLFFFPFFLSLGGRRVAWLEIKHIHHHPYAVSVDKQALNNVMKPAFLFFHVSIMFDGRATARIYASPKQWVSAVE